MSDSICGLFSRRLSEYHPVIAQGIRELFDYTKLSFAECQEFFADNHPGTVEAKSMGLYFENGEDITFDYKEGRWVASVLTFTEIPAVEARTMRGVIEALICEAHAHGAKWVIWDLRNREKDK